MTRGNGARPASPARGGEWRHGLRIDPTRTDSEEFLSALERLDELAYAPHGLATPRWALYDCAELPGAVIGLCADGDGLPEEARAALGQQGGSEAWLPITFLMALPTLRPELWLVHSICGLAEVIATPLPDLRSETMRLAYDWLGVARVRGVCQWTSDRLALHAHWGPLALEAAWLPSHDLPATCVFQYTPEVVPAPARNREACERFALDPGDEMALRMLHDEIEEGARFDVIGVSASHETRCVWIERRAVPGAPS